MSNDCFMPPSTTNDTTTTSSNAAISDYLPHQIDQSRVVKQLHQQHQMELELDRIDEFENGFFQTSKYYCLSMIDAKLQITKFFYKINMYIYCHFFGEKSETKTHKENFEIRNDKLNATSRLDKIDFSSNV